MRSPEGGDYRPQEGSPAEAYGCQTFVARGDAIASPGECSPPPGGLRLTGAEVDVGGLIDQDTTWDADLVRITSSVEVAPDVSLTVAPGTRVEFAGYFRLLVHGRLWAVGEPGNRIIFTAAAEQMTDGWDGIEFLNVPASRDSSRLEHCVLSYGVARAEKNTPAEKIVGATSRPETGGAVSIINTNKLAIASCIFKNNSADFGGAVYCGYGSSPVLAGNLFENNTAVWNGSAVFNVYAFPKLINNTIVGNECLAESDFHRCGAVDNFNGKVLFLNNIIRDNHTNHYSGMQLTDSKDYYIRANNILGYVGNDSNLDVDPGFFGGGAHPYQLTAGSPCIDFGVGDKLDNALAAYDLAGVDRVLGVALDLGAYEYCGVISAAPMAGTSLPKPVVACAPNPFNPRTRIIFELPRDSQVAVAVYDLKGRLVRSLVDDWLAAGRHELDWVGCDGKGRSLGSGTYLYRLRAGPDVVTGAMTLVR